jgi:hypothetical protein
MQENALFRTFLAWPRIEDMSRRKTFSGLALALLLLAGARAGAQGAPSWFPLEVGHHWRYHFTLSLENTPKTIILDRAVTKQARVQDRDAFIVEDKLDDKPISAETFAIEGDKVLLLASRHEGSPEKANDPPCVFLDLAKIEKLHETWSWTSKDGKSTLTGTVVEKAEWKDKAGKAETAMVVEAKFTVTSADGKSSAVLDRKIWLVRGLGIVREHSVSTLTGLEHATTIDSELDTGPAPGGK